MTDYRRNFIPGGSYFFTAALAERSGRLLTDNIDLFRRAVSACYPAIFNDAWLQLIVVTAFRWVLPRRQTVRHPSSA